MGVVTSIFSRDATPLAEDPLDGKGRADDLSFLLFRLKDMGESITPASGVDFRPRRERAFVQACHQALGGPSVGPDGRAAPGIGRMARAMLGMALFVPDALSKMILGWSPLPITPSVISLMLMVCQAYLARRKDARECRGHPTAETWRRVGCPCAAHVQAQQPCHRHHREARAVHAQPKAFAPTNIRSPATSTSLRPFGAPSMATPCP